MENRQRKKKPGTQLRLVTTLLSMAKSGLPVLHRSSLPPSSKLASLSFAFGSTARMHGRVRPLHQMCELRIHTERSRDIDWQRWSHTISFPAEPKDLFAGIPRSSRVFRCWRVYCRVGRRTAIRRQSGRLFCRLVECCTERIVRLPLGGRDWTCCLSH